MTKATKKGKAGAVNRTPPKPKKHNLGDTTAQESVSNAEANEIDKIRNIIFGRQMTTYENRFAQLEERINSQIESLYQSMAERMAAVETLVKEQNDTIMGRLSEVQAQNDAGSEALSGKIEGAKKALSKSIDTLTVQHAQEDEAIKDQLKTLSNDFSDELHINQMAAAKELDQAVQTLEDAKLDRKSLSQLLVEMSSRLTNPPE